MLHWCRLERPFEDQGWTLMRSADSTAQHYTAQALTLPMQVINVGDIGQTLLAKYRNMLVSCQAEHALDLLAYNSKNELSRFENESSRMLRFLVCMYACMLSAMSASFE